MVFDLKKIKSHPDKPLSVHILGVRDKAVRRNKSLYLELAILFHDLGKINLNFQAKLDPKLVSEGYAQHAYISAYAFLRFCATNTDYFRTELKGDMNRVRSIVAIITRHHGHLPNMDATFKELPLKELADFVAIKYDLPFDRFLKEELAFPCQSFDLKYDERHVRLAFIKTEKEKRIWQTNSLNYFYQTQYDFSCLIEADKRDAGKMGMSIWWDNNIKNNKKLANSLQSTFDDFSKGVVSSLNKIRTQLREDAEQNIAVLVKKGQRTFKLTAPTGAGKTFTMLSVAKEIQKIDSRLGIIYCLPFLSIIEQVEAICSNLLELDILSATSKSENETIEKIQKDLDEKPDKKKLDKLLREIYRVNTFDHSFILTTFVQFFETLISNRNSTLLKLPNFANRIFLIDEIQSLPPRLYIFFAAWLDNFCKKNNSYVIFSSATMPYFEIPNKAYGTAALTRKVFKDYCPPEPIISPEKYFSQNVFNRYEIHNLTDTPFFTEDLANHIIKQNQSCLVILNTIEDTKLLYQALDGYEAHKILLNTHFTAIDRLRKIKEANDYLNRKETVILISTQLIEAGVDISFPIAYRDLCPLPSLIQSAGRCNRNGDLEKGIIYFVELHKEKGGKIKISSNSIYREKADRNFLRFVKENLPRVISEKALFQFQKSFFQKVANDLSIGDFTHSDKERANMIQCINNAEFETLGRFRLIRTQDFGEQFTYFIKENELDNSYELLEVLVEGLKDTDGYGAFAAQKNKINSHIKRMRQKMVTVRVYGKNPEMIAPAWSNGEILYNIRVLSDLSAYTYANGIDLTTENQFI